MPNQPQRGRTIPEASILSVMLLAFFTLAMVNSFILAVLSPNVSGLASMLFVAIFAAGTWSTYRRWQNGRRVHLRYGNVYMLPPESTMPGAQIDIRLHFEKPLPTGEFLSAGLVWYERRRGDNIGGTTKNLPDHINFVLATIGTNSVWHARATLPAAHCNRHMRLLLLVSPSGTSSDQGWSFLLQLDD